MSPLHRAGLARLFSRLFSRSFQATNGVLELAWLLANVSIVSYGDTQRLTGAGQEITPSEQDFVKLPWCSESRNMPIVDHSSMQIFYDVLGLSLERQTFGSLHRFCIGLRSTDLSGHSRTWKCFWRSHSFVPQAVYPWYTAQFILYLTWISRHIHFAEWWPQTIMFPPPSLTVFLVFLRCNLAFVHL